MPARDADANTSKQHKNVASKNEAGQGMQGRAHLKRCSVVIHCMSTAVCVKGARSKPPHMAAATAGERPAQNPTCSQRPRHTCQGSGQLRCEVPLEVQAFCGAAELRQAQFLILLEHDCHIRGCHGLQHGPVLAGAGQGCKRPVPELLLPACVHAWGGLQGSGRPACLAVSCTHCCCGVRAVGAMCGVWGVQACVPTHFH